MIFQRPLRFGSYGFSDYKAGTVKPGKPYNENILSYDTGFEHGRAYAKIGMSMAYERHEGYDSRFEPYFARGYEAGWKVN